MAVLLSTALFEQEGKARRFFTVEEIKTAITRSKNYRLDLSDPAQAVLLLLYQTHLQQTWLAKTLNRLYCLLDDIRKPGCNVNWSMPMAEVLNADGTLKLEIVAQPLPDDRQTVGKVDLGTQYRNLLYSRQLFTVRPVVEELRLFLEKK